MPTEVYFTDHSPGHEENIWSGESDEDITVGDDKPYPNFQMHSSESSRFTVSEKSLISRSNCDSGVHDEDEDQLTSTDTDMPPLMTPEWCTRMVLSCLFV